VTADPLVSHLRAARAARAFSGAAWSVGTADGPVSRGVVGTLSWDGPPVADDTLWDLASLTKPIVGLAVMALLERGRIALSDSVEMHLPDYAGTEVGGVTVWHLLTHTGGVPGHQPLWRTHSNRSGMLRALRELRLQSPPGTRVAYSSPGFMILGLVAEAAADQPLDELVRQTVTEPVGMPDTGFNPPRDRWARTAATERCPWRGRVVQGTVHDENAHVFGGVAGHAGLFSSLGDMERLALALLRGGRTEAGRLLDAHTLHVMTSPATDHLNERRSLAWQGVDRLAAAPGDLLSARAYGHTGFTGTSVWVDPELDFYAVLLTNRVHPTRDSPQIATVRARFHNLAVLRTRRQP
jgi:CubicO group peptidase (beta-lactamase class C family)